MQDLQISLELQENQPSMDYILREAGNSDIQNENVSSEKTYSLFKAFF